MILRRNIIVLSIILLSIKAFSQNYFYDIGGCFGVNAYVKGNNKPSVFSTKKEIVFAYFFDTRKGIRTGLSYSNDLEGGKEIFQVPVYYSIRTASTKPMEILIIGSITDLINLIFPKRIELNIGPSFGFIDRLANYQNVAPTNNQFFRNEYVADRKFYTSIDIGLRPSYQFGRINFFFDFYTGLLLSRNFIYTSDNPELMGIRPHIVIKVDFGLSISL